MKLDLPAYAELPSSAIIRQSLVCQAGGLILLICHILLTKISIVFFPVGIAVAAWLYYRAPLTGMFVFFQLLIYQNWMISILSPGLTHTSYTLLQGTNFIALVIMAGLAFLRLIGSARWREYNSSLLIAIKVALITAFFYAVYGAAQDGVMSAGVYLREAESLVLMVLIGLDVGRVWGFRTLAVGFVSSAVLSICISLVEIAFPARYYDWINAANYINLKYIDFFGLSEKNGGTSPYYSGYAIFLNGQSTFFNITGETAASFQYRFYGTIMHPISYAYVLADVGLIACMVGAGWWLIPILPMLILMGVKGATLTLLMSLFIYYVLWKWTRSMYFLLFSGAALLTSFIAFGIIKGIADGDFHVIGFLGGVHGFMHNPIGHGIGSGGNFSPQALRGFNWQTLQQSGADFALESAVGVLLYQMGIASVTILAIVFLLFGRSTFASNRPRPYDLAFIALAVTMANGVFQEEAYTPYAAGLFTLMCAVLVANGQRQSAICSPKTLLQRSMYRRRAIA